MDDVAVTKHVLLTLAGDNVENDDDDDFNSKVNTDSEEEDENYDSGQDKEPVSNDMTRDWKSISDSDSDNESVASVASLPHH